VRASTAPGRCMKAALTDAEKDATVAAYKRTDYFEQRRPMMIEWAKFLTGTSAASSRKLKRVVTNEIAPASMVA